MVTPHKVGLNSKPRIGKPLLIAEWLAEFIRQSLYTNVLNRSIRERCRPLGKKNPIWKRKSP